MGLFLLILGIFLALNIFPIIAGFLSMDNGEGFMVGFLAAWAVEFIIAVIIGLFTLIIWLISTGWTMMQEPAEVY